MAENMKEVRNRNAADAGNNAENYTWNRECLLKNGQPWFPVMGEMHYSRYKAELWEESLRKMKAGGVDIVASYLIWIHHEEEEGTFLFDGNLDIGRFVRLCGKAGLKLFLRLGPWCHGEVRNGGFPDWLMKKGFCLRSDDKGYLSYVERLWRAVYRQLEGLFWEQGGPIIGIQIENEYGHAGGYGGEEGERHMRTLTRLAREIGFHAPYYTATGWGGAVTGGLLPVMGGYCEAPWDKRLTELEANENYVFTGNRNDANIANDYQEGEGQKLTFRPEEFPFLTAELGGGLQPTHHRRPVTTGQDIGAMSLTKLGSGVALLGYYMYHGGSNPMGKFSTLQESRATGSPNDLPVINYDFCAPVRQYGQISDTYKEIKLLSLFLRDFGSQLAALPSLTGPEHTDPEDTQTLRLAWRCSEEGGFVFYNNYQRKRTMQEHLGTVLTGKCACPVEFPAADILPGEYGFFPYRLNLDGKVLLSALATPLCRLDGRERDEETCYVFYGDREPAFSWQNGKAAKTLHISRKDALNAWKVTLDREYLILCEDYVWEENGGLHVTGGRNTLIKAWPRLPDLTLPGLTGFRECGQEGEFTLYSREIPGKASTAAVRMLEAETGKDAAVHMEYEYSTGNEASLEYEITVEYGEHIEDCFLILEYAGDGLQVWQDGRLLNDHFYTGQKVELSMRYFDFPKSLRVKVSALYEGAPCFLEKWPPMKNGIACELLRLEIREQCAEE